MSEIMDDDALAELLQKYGFKDNVDGYFEAMRLAGIPQEAARVKHTVYSVLTEHNRRIVEMDELAAIFRARSVPFDVSHYISFCQKYGRFPEEIFQRFFILEFINRCREGKPLEEQKSWIKYLSTRKGGTSKA